MFIVAGASGNVGSAAVRKLAESGAAVKALTRSSTSDKVAPLKDLANVEVVECDLTDKSALASVFAGAKGAILTYGNCKEQVEAEKNFIDCAVAAGCLFLVKIGTVRCYTAEDSPCEYARYHAEIEKHLAETAGAMKWAVLSPNWFISNHLGDVFGTLPNNVVVYPVSPDSKTSMVDTRDVGDIAAKMILASDASAYHGLKLDISGPEAVSLAQMAQLYSEALGRPVTAIKCSNDEWIAGAIGAGFQEWHARAVTTHFEKWEEGALCFPTAPEVLALAPPQRTVAAWIKEWAPRSPPPA
ncbi:unnamed protein product [Polarella glacialis]|uniref:NmrA-like domain-containing protein n=1 Tax=Polarella glacialis TaxID=89957 RepID=A0A813HSF2_POLGL|nr:unnamed protein product [Polarella glacialis]